MSDPLENGGENEQTEADPLAVAFGTAQDAAERGDWPAAVEAGEAAVELGRKAGESDAALRTLSIMLYNLATFYAQAKRFDDAVQALEEVVALDERTGHEDLESDRETLEQARKLASMTPEEKAAVQAQVREAEIAHIVEAVQQQAVAVLDGEREVGQAVEQLQVAAEQAAGDQALGEAREDLAGYFSAVAAVLSGDTPEAVPAAYATQIAALREQTS